MGLFSPNKNNDSAPAQPAVEPQRVPTPTGGKSAPTPRRKDAEAARRQRVNPQLSPKEAKARARQDAAADRRKQTEAIDNVPGRKLMRAYVDTRFNLAEWAMPILMVLLLLTLVVSPAVPVIIEPVTYATWAFMLLVAFDIWRMWRGFKQLAAERIPNEPLKGLLYYGFNRALSLRRLRIPRPVLKRGDSF